MNLNEDVEKVIASFCGPCEAAQLANVSKNWRHAVLNTKLHFEGPSNGNTLSTLTCLANGPVNMPHVQHITLNDQSNTNLFKKCLDLAGPQLPDLRRRWHPSLELFLTYSFELTNLKDSLKNILFSLIYFKCTYYGATVDFHLNTQELICHSIDYCNNVFEGLHTLTLFNVTSLVAEDLLAIQKALQEKQLKSLEINGLLTDALISRMHFKSNSLTRLYLHYESICTWDTAQVLQKCMPNIEYFGLRSSNLMLYQLENFDWHLWPNLKGLDFENNYTLEGEILVPKTLTNTLHSRKHMLAFCPIVLKIIQVTCTSSN